MKKLIKLLQWIDNNLIKILLFGFVFVIPLYPKFPIKIVDYTYIAIRAEDFYIGLLVIVFLIQILRQKIAVNTKFLWLFLTFWILIFISFALNAFITKYLIYAHLGFLHAARRVEYMIIFFITTSSIKSKKELVFFVDCIIAALTLVTLYGIGQKFFGLPAVQTMNPEFAKGHLLQLTPEARVSSTFAGHYDLAAYLVLLIPITVGMYFYKKNFIYLIITVFSIFVLSLTASRISTAAYAVSILAYLIYIRKPKVLIFILIVSSLCALVSNNLIARFLKTVQVKQIFVNEKTGEVVVPQKITSKELPAGNVYIAISSAPKENSAQVEQQLKKQLLDDIYKEASQEHKTLTSTEAAQILATRSAQLTAQNTIVADISFTTRLQVEWPRAIKALLKDPVFGTGPSSITESTDNDYLRWLGEFGLAGTIAFLYILYTIFFFIWKHTKNFAENERILYFGFLAGMLGLLMNAAYIDVFEASKVAYVFWLTAGLFVASLIPGKKTAPSKIQKK